MCSISWLFKTEGYDLFFTRDEQRSRSLAEAPCLNDTETGVRYLAPSDPQGGGTWIFINEHGLSGAVLNAYEVELAEPPKGQLHSRGQLLRALAPANNLEQFAVSLSARTIDHTYPPCYLMAFCADGAFGFWLWDGQCLHNSEPPAQPFFTTSSVMPSEVRAYRNERFAREIGTSPTTPEALKRFHRDEAGPCTAFDVRMSRADAQSVSLTHVSCRPQICSMSYAPREGRAHFDGGSVIHFPRIQSTPSVES